MNSNVLPDALILYIPGSAGDFLKICCGVAVGETVNFEIKPTGQFAVSDVNWKNFVDSLNNNVVTIDQVHQALIEQNAQFSKIENGHHYFNWFKDTDINLFYIDFDNKYIEIIVDTFIRKAFNNNESAFLSTFNVNSKDEIIKRNLMLKQVYFEKCKAVDIKDFWDFDKTLANIKTIIGKDIINKDLIYFRWKNWVKLNKQLKQELDIV
jgi:hypothetical protein